MMSKSASGRKPANASRSKTMRESEVSEDAIPPEVLDSVPDEIRIGYLQSQSYKGPLPPPVLFQRYEETLPGAAERIMLLTEREQAHRQEWERSALDAHRADSRRSQWLGFGLAAMGMTSTVVCALLGSPTVAIASVVPVVVGILASIFNRAQTEKE